MSCYDNATLQDLAKATLQVQDACNLTAVVYAFADVCTRLRKLFPAEGTEFFNKHPIVILWLDKLNSLAGIQDLANQNVLNAYKVVYALEKG